MLHRFVCAAALGLGAAALAAPAGAQSAPLTVDVDARDAARSILHTHLRVPAKAGAFTLHYPKWIPGEHMPSGPIANVASVVVRANGAIVPWRRDDVDGFAYHVEVPQGVTALDVRFDFLLGRGGNFSAGASSDPSLAVINWNQLVMLPEGYRSHDLQITPSITLPPGWRYGTALPGANRGGDAVHFGTVSIETLVDSPLAAGLHYRRFPLYDAHGATAEIDAISDSEAALDWTPQTVAQYRNLVREALALYGARHWQHYHFLFTLSDNVTSFGLEHHESSDDRVPESSIVDPALREASASLLPHEFTHSWNGKFRRPAGLATPDFEHPMQDDLLWVYEGLTNYLGEVLSFRMGMRDPKDFPDELAATAANLDAESGRATRSLADTAIFAPYLYNSPHFGFSARRGTDFYAEGTLMWLEADTIVRQQSRGGKSLDDFCRAFLGMRTTRPAVVPYSRADVIAALGRIAPYDWAGFFHDRLDIVTPASPRGGFTRGGYKLVYTARPSKWTTYAERRSKSINLAGSLGMTIGEDGVVGDIGEGTPAALAGIGYGMKVVALGGRMFSREALDAALRDNARSGGPLQVITDDQGVFTVRSVDYRGGPRYPHLVRVPGTVDLLVPIASPHRTGA
ncbi:MAG: M61 family metallopeptidase [Candidatus Velthaea sp.]